MYLEKINLSGCDRITYKIEAGLDKLVVLSPFHQIFIINLKI